MFWDGKHWYNFVRKKLIDEEDTNVELSLRSKDLFGKTPQIRIKSDTLRH